MYKTISTKGITADYKEAYDYKSNANTEVIVISNITITDENDIKQFIEKIEKIANKKKIIFDKTTVEELTPLHFALAEKYDDLYRIETRDDILYVNEKKERIYPRIGWIFNTPYCILSKVKEYRHQPDEWKEVIQAKQVCSDWFKEEWERVYSNVEKLTNQIDWSPTVQEEFLKAIQIFNWNCNVNFGFEIPKVDDNWKQFVEMAKIKQSIYEAWAFRITEYRSNVDYEYLYKIGIDVTEDHITISYDSCARTGIALRIEPNSFKFGLTRRNEGSSWSDRMANISLLYLDNKWSMKDYDNTVDYDFVSFDGAIYSKGAMYISPIGFDLPNMACQVLDD
jgi:hypothetical protein